MGVTVEELGDFLRQSPPRSIPRPIRRAVSSGSGCFLIVFGVVFLGFGGVFAAFFFPWRIVDNLRLSWGTPAVAVGGVTAADRSRASENDRPIYRMEFQFRSADGVVHQGRCYRTGDSYAVGDEIDVEYLASKPQAARLRGCRLDVFSWGAMFVIIFPLIGGGIVGGYWWNRSRQLSLLRNGVFSSATIQAVEATNVTVNNQRRHKVRVAFDLVDVPHQSSFNAYGPQVALAQHRQQTGESIGLLVDPARPQRILMVDSLLTSPSVTTGSATTTNTD